MRQSQAIGVLTGSVSRGPRTPNEPAHGRQQGQVGGARIDIATSDNKPVTSVLTYRWGRFSVNLPPGTYRVTMPAMHGARPRNMPATVIIAGGVEKRLDIFLDTGLR